MDLSKIKYCVFFWGVKGENRLPEGLAPNSSGDFIFRGTTTEDGSSSTPYALDGYDILLLEHLLSNNMDSTGT